MKLYTGTRTANGCLVTVDDPGAASPPKLLSPRFDLRNHSPTGFEWGYCGSGPAQLALALLADSLGSDISALEMYQSFKSAVVVNFAQPGFTITEQQIRDWVSEYEQRA